MIKTVIEMTDNKVADKEISYGVRNPNENQNRGSSSSPGQGSEPGRFQNGSYHEAGQKPYYFPPKKLYKSTRDKWLGGVCGGIAEYFNKDPVLVRLLWVVVTIFSAGVGIIAYLLFWLFLDKTPSYYTKTTEYMTQDQRGVRHYHHYYQLSQ